MSDPDLEADLELALDIARDAGDALRRRFRILGPNDVRFKGVRDLVTEADLEAETIVTDRLRRERPDHRVLSEEEWSGARVRSTGAPPGGEAAGPAGATGRTAEIVGGDRPLWIVDPLDGTTNFAHGHPFFAVSIARVDQGRPVVGVIYAPALGELYSARLGGGAWFEGSRMTVSRTETVGEAIFATGFPYRRDQLDDMQNNIAHTVRFLREVRGFRRGGSAALDLAYVAAGRFDFFFERQLEPWDVAAGALLVREAGGEVSDYRGGERWLTSREILASNGRLHETVRARLRSP